MDYSKELADIKQKVQELEAKLQEEKPMSLEQYYRDRHMYFSTSCSNNIGYNPYKYCSKHSAEKFRNLRKLSHIAYMLNGGDFVPENSDSGCFVYVDKATNDIRISYKGSISSGEIYFKTYKLAEQARQYITDEELKKALL